MKFVSLSVVSLLIAMCFLSACGGGGTGMGGQTFSVAPTITTQPADQSTPLGQTANFSVVATGTQPLRYQWSKNGTPITGATNATLMTSAVAVSDDGESFTVTVSNSTGQAVSKAASLKVGPRSPQAGDLRFQQVGSPATVNGYGNTGTPLFTNLLGRGGWGFTNFYGTPLTVGANCFGTAFALNCNYSLAAFELAPSVPALKFNYTSDFYSSLDSKLAGIIAPDTVITSISLQPANDEFGLLAVQSTTATGFQYIHQTVPLSNLQSYATQLGAQGKVITAVSFDGAGDVYVVAYSWQNDPSTIYESKVSSATVQTAGDEATQLAAEGYIVTALGGGNDSPTGAPSSGLLLVGTRVQGDNLPRPLKVVPDHTTMKTDLMDPGYAIVGYIQDPNGFAKTWIGEK